MDDTQLAGSIGVGLAIVFALIALGFVWACVIAWRHERRAQRLARWTDEDTRAAHLHAQERGYER